MPEKVEYCYSLFIVTKELQQPKSTTATSLATQTVFIPQHTVSRVTVAYGSTESAAKVHSCNDKHHRQQHLQWVHEQRNWTIEELKKVAWSDDSYFLVHHIVRGVRICRFTTDILATRCTVDQR